MIRAFMLSLAMLFAAPVIAHAEITAADKAQADQVVDAFFKGLNDHKTEAAYGAFMLPLVSEQQEMMAKLITVTDQVVAYFDKPFKTEKVAESTLGDNLISRKYIMYNDKSPYVVTMVLFRTTTGWRCQTVQLRDLTADDFN